ncbi:MAG: hypothetical protein OXF55_06300 [Caldilineaceae bacterium]|nr:hypothetical protein [Caldilineaceae bacterium]
MCIILDANLFGNFDDPHNEDMRPVHRWLSKQNGKIVYSDTSKFRDEWMKGGNVLLERLRQDGSLRLVPRADVEQIERSLEGTIQSDDEHIVALALVADVRVLVSNDKALHQDFKCIVRGKVYQTKSHAHLLRRDTCP